MAVLGFATAAAAQPVQTFTVIDRTMTCAMALSGGAPDQIRTLRLSIHAKRGSGPQQFDPGLHFGTGHIGLVRVYTQQPPQSVPNVLVHRHRCTRLKARMPLLPEERSAGAIEFEGGCKVLDAPARTVVRFHAVLERPTRLSPYRRDFLIARGTAVEAFIAIRTPARRPIAFASFDRDGSARLFRTPRCTEE
jgi:hypothetical protein